MAGQLAGEQQLRIGTEGTYAPFTYHDESGKLVGFDVEIGEAIAGKLGVKPEFIEGKWDGLIAGLDANRYDTVINQVGITYRLSNSQGEVKGPKRATGADTAAVKAEAAKLAAPSPKASVSVKSEPPLSGDSTTIHPALNPAMMRFRAR